MTVHAPDHLGGTGRRTARYLDKLVLFPGWSPRDPALAPTLSYFNDTFDPPPCEHRGMSNVCAQHLAPVAGRCDKCWTIHIHRHHEGAEPAFSARAILGATGATVAIHCWR